MRDRPTAVVAVGSVLLTGAALGDCSEKGGSSDTSASGPRGLITVTTGAAGSYVDNFNPFSPNVQAPANGMIYEPLFYFNTVKAGDIQPWLGTRYTWSDAGKTLTVQLRSGVRWTDGKPFTSEDVAFTFGLAIKDKAFNSYNLPLTQVTADNPTQVTLRFSKPAYSDLYYIAGKTMILPKHIWQSVDNPKTWLNPKPVGTGAYVLSRISGQLMEFTANPHYYMPGLPKIKTLRFLSFSGNTASDAAIESGQID